MTVRTQAKLTSIFQPQEHSKHPQKLIHSKLHSLVQPVLIYAEYLLSDSLCIIFTSILYFLSSRPFRDLIY
jgi:hypothetical protein